MAKIVIFAPFVYFISILTNIDNMTIIAEILVFSLFSPKLLEYQVFVNFPKFRTKFWLF